MGLFKIGETARDGRQKRIEHTGRYLRASRTGGVSLRAQTRVAGANVTANTRHGLRVSARLARGTQIAMQNGRFVLRGRYGGDALSANLSKSGVTLSSKTPVGSINWIKPGRSSFKLAGVQLRGHKAAYLQAIFALFALAAWAAVMVFQIIALLFQVLCWGVRVLAWPLRAFLGARARARLERERLGLGVAEAAAPGARVLERAGVDLAREPRGDLFAGLVFTLTCLGRGSTRFEPRAVGLGEPGSAAEHALGEHARAAGEQINGWLGAGREAPPPEDVLGLTHHLARALGQGLEADARAEVLFSLDDACLGGGPRTVLQEAMLDVLAETLAVNLLLEGET